MGDINFDFDFSEIERWITNFERQTKKLDNKIERQVKLSGAKMQREYKKLAPKKTGRFSRQLRGKLSVSLEEYNYTMQNTKNWGRGIFVMNEKGTKLRHRTKIHKNQQTRGYYSTGRVRPRGLTTKIKKETEKEFKKRMEKILQEFGSSL